MYQTEDVLPFLDKAKTIKKTIRTISTNDIYCAIKEAKPIQRPLMASVKQAILVQPLGMIILNANPIETYHIKQQFKYLTVELKEVNYRSVAKNITFGTRNDGTYCAYYPNVTGLLEEIVSQNNYVVDALSEQIKYIPEFLDLLPESFYANTYQSYKQPIQESLKSDIDFSDDLSKNMKISDSAHIEILRSYLSSSTQTNQVPLLLGKTAVAKSAIIKCLCEEFNAKYNGKPPYYGMRIVDIRASFMEKTDIEGLCKTVKMKKNSTEQAKDGDDFQLFSASAPMSKLVECSDGYINYCRDAIAIIEKQIRKLRASGESKEKIESLTILLETYLEGAKIPVLFFDEITRCSKSVMQCLTKILNDKNFMGYNMKIARVVAATNTNADKPREIGDDSGFDELSSIYQTSDISDQAVFDRFSSMLVTPSDVFASWKEWGKTGTPPAIHTLVMNYVTSPRNNNTSLVYDQSDIENLLNEPSYYDENGQKQPLPEGDILKEASATSFPNFRTWEMISKLLYNGEPDKQVLFSQIKGLIGNRAGFAFCEYIQKAGWTDSANKEEDADPMLEMVNECMKNGTPTMLIAPSSVGKTSRVKQAVKANDAEFIEINLAECEKGDLMGLMTMVKTTDYITQGLGQIDESLSKDLSSLLKTKYNDMNDDGLPENITIRAPRVSMAEKFIRAVLANRKVVLFFDEVNRVQDTAVMSALFEAVSDHRIFGYDFTPFKDNVRVICACNLGDNMAQASELDPAFAARFSIFRKRDYDQKDVNNFLAYAEKQNFTPELMSFLQAHKDDGLVLEMLKSVDRRSLEMGSSSSRAIEDLDKLIRASKETKEGDCQGNSIFAGTILFPNGTETRNISDSIDADSDITEQQADSLLSSIDQRIDNWAAFLTNVATAKGIVENVTKTYKKIRKEGLAGNDIVGTNKKENVLKLLKSLIKIDNMIATTRGKMISSKIGNLSYGISDFGHLFTVHYNQVSGTDTDDVKASEIVNENRIEAYINCAIRKRSTLQPCEMVVTSYKPEAPSILHEVFEAFYSFEKINVRKLFFGGDTPDTIGSGGIMSKFPVDTRGTILLEMLRDEDGLSVLIQIEDNESDYIVKMLNFCGLNITKKEVDEILARGSTVLTTYFK